MLLNTSVLPAFRLNEKAQIEPFGSGLINNTWKVNTNNERYILQRVNTNVFKEPESIAHNIRLISAYFKQHYPEYKFVAPLLSTEGEEFFCLKEEGFFRIFPFVQDSVTLDVVQTPQQAYEAAQQFGRFTHLLSGFDACQLKITIPSFHDLSLRYHQFQQALENGDSHRIAETKELIETLTGYVGIVSRYEQIIKEGMFKLRVIHHDTKISNVLFNSAGKGLCVIDLDTVMPGYFISDVGDMMRTYLSPVSEEEGDFSKIEVRDDFYHAIVEGYSSEMKDELNVEEQNSFFFAGTFMIYMQALRFLTDYLNRDIYYGARYPAHNLVRATNQVTLLQRLIEKEAILTKENRGQVLSNKL